VAVVDREERAEENLANTIKVSAKIEAYAARRMAWQTADVHVDIQLQAEKRLELTDRASLSEITANRRRMIFWRRTTIWTRAGVVARDASRDERSRPARDVTKGSSRVCRQSLIET
jgi:hypothetical protein